MKWTEEEINILFENYTKYGAIYCSKILNRGVKAIIRKAKLLKLKFSKIKEIYIEENFRKIVENSNSIAQVIANLSLRKAGGNYIVVNKYIKLYKIDISHFKDQKERYNYMIKNYVLRPLDSVLIENSNYSRGSLKKRLYKEGFLERKCCLCGQDENWNGMKISLILDHINGVHNDNRIENLRIVCPNCNAGLDTFAGKNSKNDIGIIKDKIINTIQ